MNRLDLTLSPAMNIAFDDALLERAESSQHASETLRFWEPEAPMVVIGRSSPLSTEVNLDYCRAHRIPVFRRISGGQSIVTGPGCLMYAVLLDYRLRPELRMLDQAHQFVTDRLRQAITSFGLTIEINGTCDLTYQGRKFSGNALRCRRNWFLYHGTILLQDFDLELLTRALGQPLRQPDYREQRTHDEFVTTVPLPMDAVKEALAKQFDATAVVGGDPLAGDGRLTLAKQLVASKYGDPEWLAKVP